jgi:hypothetical protein
MMDEEPVIGAVASAAKGRNICSAIAHVVNSAMKRRLTEEPSMSRTLGRLTCMVHHINTSQSFTHGSMCETPRLIVI